MSFFSAPRFARDRVLSGSAQWLLRACGVSPEPSSPPVRPRNPCPRAPAAADEARRPCTALAAFTSDGSTFTPASLLTPSGARKLEVATAEVGGFVDAVVAREGVEFFDREILLRFRNDGRRFVLGLAEDPPQVHALGRVETRAIFVVVLLHVLDRDGGRGLEVAGSQSSQRGGASGALELMLWSAELRRVCAVRLRGEDQIVNEDLVDVGLDDLVAGRAKRDGLKRRDLRESIFELSNGHRSRTDSERPLLRVVRRRHRLRRRPVGRRMHARGCRQHQRAARQRTPRENSSRGRVEGCAKTGLR